MQIAVCLELRIRACQGDGERLSFLPLALAGVVGGSAIALDAFDAALFLLVIGLGAFARRQICLGLRQFLTP